MEATSEFVLRVEAEVENVSETVVLDLQHDNERIIFRQFVQNGKSLESIRRSCG